MSTTAVDKRKYNSRKEYFKEYYKNYYNTHPEYKAKQQERDKLRRLTNHSKYLEWKSSLRCKLCDERESCCLEFHHLDPKEKDYTISAISGKSMAFILKEAAKCVVLCSNCHKKVHAGVAQLVECDPSKFEVASSSLAARST